MENLIIQNEKIPNSVERLKLIFEENKGKRICVVGPSCVGKSTLLKYLSEAVDMDDLLFGSEERGIKPLLSQEEIDYVCSPWTPEIGNFMSQKARELIKIDPRHPVFGTIVFLSDIIVEITLPDDLLRERIRCEKE